MKDVRIEDILLHDRFVRRLALELMGDVATAEDVTQQVYLEAMTRPPHDGGSLRGWLSTVLRHIGLNIRRGGAHRVERERRASHPEAQDTDRTIVEREEIRRHLVAAILELGTPRSTIIFMRYFEGATPRAIASRLEMPAETVRTHLKRGLAVLRERLGSESRPDGTNVLMALPILLTAPRGLGAAMGAVMTAKAKLSLVCAGLVVGAAVLWMGGPRADDAQATERTISRRDSDTATGDATDENGMARVPRMEGPRRFPQEAAESTALNAIEGTVVDGSGSPIPAARVFACDSGAGIAIPPPGAIQSALPIPSATADGSGQFSIPLDPPRRLVTLCAMAAGFSPVIDVPAKFGDRRTLVLERPTRIVGRTLDTSNNPLKGVRVRWSSASRQGEVRLAREAISQEDGHFEIADLPSGALARTMLTGMVLEAHAPGFAPLALLVGETRTRWGTSSPRDVSFSPGAKIEQDLILARGARIIGRLLDAETNAPIPNETIRFHSFVSPEAKQGSIRAGEDRLARTDDHGAYAFDLVPSTGFHPLGSNVAGQIVGELTAQPPGFAKIRLRVPEKEEGGVIDLDVACWRTASAKGRVVNATGVPQAGVGIWGYAAELHDSGAGPVTTDPAGRFVLDAIPARSSTPTKLLIVASPSGSQALQTTDGSARREISLRAGDRVELDDFVVDAFPSIRFRIVDSAGLPIAGATAQASLRGWQERSDRAGRCNVLFVPAALGKPQVVRIRATGFSPVVSEGLLPAVESPETTVVLEPGHEVRGRVIWSDRSPARGVTVSLTEGAAPPPRAPNGASTASETDYIRAPRLWNHTAEDGRFEFVDLAAPPYFVTVSAGSPGSSPSEPQVLLSDVRESNLEIVLPSDPLTLAAQQSDGIVEGTVRSADSGQPVTAFFGELSNATAHVGAIIPTLGRFRIEGVPRGKWNLHIESRGFSAFDREIEIGSSPLRADVVLLAGLEVVGAVRVPKGIALAEVQLVFVKADHASVPAVIAADGTYRAAGLAPGRYFINISYPNAGRWDKALAATMPLEMTLEAGRPPLHRDVDVVRGGWLHVGIPTKLLKAPGRALLSFIDASGMVARELEIIYREGSSGFGSDFPLPEGTYRVRLSSGTTTIAQAQGSAIDGTPGYVNLE